MGGLYAVSILLLTVFASRTEAGEHPLHTGRVVGSIPITPTPRFALLPSLDLDCLRPLPAF